MDGFHNILYVERHLRGGVRGFVCALELARAQGANLTVAGCIRSSGRVEARTEAGATQRREAAIGRWRRRLQDLADRAAPTGVMFRPMILEGNPGTALLEEAARGDHDLLVKVADRAPVFPWLFDDPDRRLVRECAIPTLILDPAQAGELKVILVAIDAGRPDSTELNMHILATGAAIARPADGSLNVVHAWSLVGDSLFARDWLGRHRYRDRVATKTAELRRQIEQLLERAAPGLTVPIELPHGRALDSVVDVACRSQADVVVVGISDRRRLDRLMMNSLAERILRRVPGSVLVTPTRQRTRTAPRRRAARSSTHGAREAG